MKWLFEIIISDIIRNYDNDESKINDIAQTVAERIKQSKAYERFPKSLNKILTKIKTTHTEAEFNRVLNELYDFCDAHAIWLENFP